MKLTVDAFKGNWKFDGTMSATGMPGMDKPVTTKMNFNCKVVAGKTAVACEAKAKTPMGPMDALFVVAYDPYLKAAHFMGISNMNEVHDHQCKWSGLSLTCASFKGGMGPGLPADRQEPQLQVGLEDDQGRRHVHVRGQG